MSNKAKDVPEFDVVKSRGLKAFLDSSNGPLPSIPDFYVVPPSIRPVNSTINPSKAPQLPVIDLADLHTSRRSQVVQAIGHACEEWGFFQVVNHGVPSSVPQGMMSAAQQFFDLPFEDKEPYFAMDFSDYATHTRFSTSFNPDKETFLQWKDALTHPLFPAQIDTWPHKPPCYRENASRYSDEMVRLSSHLLAAISESLGLASDHLVNLFGQIHLGFLANYYPASPNPDLTIGLRSHRDMVGFAILLQDDVSALQIKHNDIWVPVQPIADAFVINLGDQLQILSNGKYKSVEHRAVSTLAPRVSIVTFIQPQLDSIIAPIPSLLDEFNLPMYKEVVFKDYLSTFLASELDQLHIDMYRVEN